MEGAEPPPDGEVAGDGDGDGDLEAYEGADYDKALAMWNEILVRFPQYRQRDGVLYLLAYYLNQIGEERRGLGARARTATTFEPEVDRTLDALADHVAEHVDLAALARIAGVQPAPDSASAATAPAVSAAALR